MKAIYLNEKRYELPETWQEVAPDLLPDFVRLLFAEPANGDTYHEILRRVLGYSKAKWRKLMAHYFAPQLTEAQREANAVALSDTLTQIAWMWHEPLSAMPFESIVVGGQTYYLPEAQFTTMSYGELTDAYIHFLAFVKQLVPGEERLNLLIASICRPERQGDYQTPDWNGDRREPYNEHLAKLRADGIAQSVSYAERIAILMYFAGTQKSVLELYDVHAEGIEAAATEEDYPGQGWKKNQHYLSEKGIFGNLNGVKEANVHEVLLYLEESKKDFIEQKKRQEAENRKNDTH